MSMKMAPEVNPLPGTVSEQELLSPELGFSMAAELGIVFRKILQGLGFFNRDKYIVRTRSGGGPEGRRRAVGMTPL